MVSNPQSRWAVAGGTFVLWALVAVSAVYWGIKLSSRPAGSAVPLAVRSPAPTDPQALARLLGFNPVAQSAGPVASFSSRFVLVGVVASRGNGAALIAVDGKPAKPFRVGAAVEEGLVLQAVEGRRAMLGAGAGGPPTVTLELPPLRR